MKKLICLLLCCVMVMSLCACKSRANQKGIMSDDSSSDQQAVSVDFPAPKKLTYEDSDNNLGARYIFTLKEYNKMLNEACEELSTTGIDTYFEYKNWKLMSKNLQDDNGIAYSSYYYATDTLTITAAVENESGKVMNIACGTEYKTFAQADADYQYTVMLTAAILAMVAGGYEHSDLEFLYYVFFDSAKNNEKFFYHNSVYMFNISKAKDEDSSAALFMMSPCKDEIKSEWELTDYKSFEGSARDNQAD